MNVLGSECSGDCESGWTLYLEQSFLSHQNSTHRDKGKKFVAAKSGFCGYEGKKAKQENDEEEEEEEEEEDLSMVSDASSGPPHFHEVEACFNYESGYFYPALKDATLLDNGGKRPKMKERRHREDQELTSFLDDTASSPAFNFSRNNFALANNQASTDGVLDYSQGFSATHFEKGRSAFQDHYGYMQPSLSGNRLQNNQWF